METKIILVVQAKEDADRLIVTSVIEMASDFEKVVIVGEDVDLLVIFNGLNNPTHSNIYFHKCGRGKKPDILYSTNSISSDRHLILFADALSGCDSTSCFFGQGKAKLLM